MFYLCNIKYIINSSYLEVKTFKFTKQYLTTNLKWFKNQKIQNVQSTLITLFHIFVCL